MTKAEIKELNRGYKAIIEKKVSRCEKCKNVLDIGNWREVFYCDQDKCFYCNKCMTSHRVKRNHIDWNVLQMEVKK